MWIAKFKGGYFYQEKKPDFLTRLTHFIFYDITWEKNNEK